MITRHLTAICLLSSWAVASWAADEFPLQAEVAFKGQTFSQPLGIVPCPGKKNVLFIVEKTGRVQMLEGLGSDKLTKREVFNITQPKDGKFETGGECGLLGFALHPKWEENKQVFVYYSLKINNKLYQRLARFALSSANPLVVDASSEQPLMTQLDPASNHNGGDVHFGPDGYLYFSCGDGGAGNDVFNNAGYINKGFFAGIFRIDVDKRPGSLAPNPGPSVNLNDKREAFYAIPSDNPFIGASSHRGQPVDPKTVRTEVWATGMRNPWRFSFDPAKGTCFAGDVGQNLFEEIDVVVAGGDYGWSIVEGLHEFNKKDPSGKQQAPKLLAPEGFVKPIFEYDRKLGNSVTGGVVARETQVAALKDAYVFGDFGSGRIIALREKDGKWEPQVVAKDLAVAGLGVDPLTGDVLIASLGGEVKRLVNK
jgi:glucose/arabinose dehydrogenase